MWRVKSVLNTHHDEEVTNFCMKKLYFIQNKVNNKHKYVNLTNNHSWYKKWDIFISNVGEIKLRKQE